MCWRSAYRFESISGTREMCWRSAYRFESISGTLERCWRAAYRFKSISGTREMCWRAAYRFESISGTLERCWRAAYRFKTISVFFQLFSHLPLCLFYSSFFSSRFSFLSLLFLPFHISPRLSSHSFLPFPLFPFFFPPNYPFTSRDLPFLPLFLASSSSFSLLTILILLITQNISLSHIDTHLFNLELTCTSHKTQCTVHTLLRASNQICNPAHPKPMQQ